MIEFVHITIEQPMMPRAGGPIGRFDVLLSDADIRFCRMIGELPIYTVLMASMN